jgi:calcineurin-like phosphoesterase family protein
MSNIYFIADTHFGHQNIIEYENRPFPTVEEMDRTLIANWNRTVKKREKVYLLGDFAFANKERIIELAASLNGYKILLLGNHDKCYSYSWWQTAGFDEVIPYPIIFNEWFILSHEPVYVNTNMPYANIYGHVHSNPSYTDCSTQSFCVSVERINYTPIEFGEIIRRIGQSKQESDI